MSAAESLIVDYQTETEARGCFRANFEQANLISSKQNRISLRQNAARIVQICVPVLLTIDRSMPSEFGCISPLVQPVNSKQFYATSLVNSAPLWF